MISLKTTVLSARRVGEKHKLMSVTRGKQEERTAVTVFFSQSYGRKSRSPRPAGEISPLPNKNLLLSEIATKIWLRVTSHQLKRE